LRAHFFQSQKIHLYFEAQLSCTINLRITFKTRQIGYAITQMRERKIAKMKYYKIKKEHPDF
jgi:hypothetical protein